MGQSNFEGVPPLDGAFAQVTRPQDPHLPMLVFDGGPGSVEKLPIFHRLLCPAPGLHSKHMHYNTNARVSNLYHYKMHLPTHLHDFIVIRCISQRLSCYLTLKDPSPNVFPRLHQYKMHLTTLKLLFNIERSISQRLRFIINRSVTQP